MCSSGQSALTGYLPYLVYDMSNITEALKNRKHCTHIKFKHDIETESYDKQNMFRQAQSLFTLLILHSNGPVSMVTFVGNSQCVLCNEHTSDYKLSFL